MVTTLSFGALSIFWCWINTVDGLFQNLWTSRLFTRKIISEKDIGLLASGWIISLLVLNKSYLDNLGFLNFDTFTGSSSPYAVWLCKTLAWVRTRFSQRERNELQTLQRFYWTYLESTFSEDQSPESSEMCILQNVNIKF